MADFFRNVVNNVTDFFTPGPPPVRRRPPAAPQAPRPQNQCPAPPRDQNQTRTRPQATQSRGDVCFPGMTPQVRDLYNAIRAYPNEKPETRPTDAQAREIAIEVDAASRTFKVDPKVMLAIFAHESQGFDVRAQSPTGAKGLGQLTGIAIDEVRRLSYDETFPETRRVQIEHYPVEAIRAQLERPDIQAIFRRVDQREENRFHIRDNIWTSTAYARIAMDRAAQWGATSPVMGFTGMLGRYNAAGGAQQREYDDKVAAAYQTLFHRTIPQNLSTR